MSTPPRENLTRDEAATRASLLSDVVYDVTLDLTLGKEVFGSTTRIEFRAAPGSSTFVDVTANRVDRAVLNGEELAEDAVGATRIQLDTLQEQNVLVVEAVMDYRHEGSGLSRFVDPADDRVYLHSQFEPFDAHLVYACFDQPDLKAPHTFTVDAPEEWVVVSNSPCIESPDEGAAGRWRFSPTPPVSTYYTAVVAGSYQRFDDVHGDIPLGIYVRRSLAHFLDVDNIVEITRQGLDWFTENFGRPYPFEKYDQLFVPEFSAGAMENSGCITFSESYVFRSKVTDAIRERRAETILHEMAHMWFGDLVTMKWWDDLWLNESFATFCSVLCQSLATRFDQSWVTFADSEKNWAKFQDQLPSTHPIAADMVDIESVHQNFDGITYAKGASVLRQLVAWVGQEEFLAGCRLYFDRHEWGNAELADFLAALVETSGRGELSSWKDEWLTTTGVNTLALEYEVADGRIQSPMVVQTAPDDHPTLRSHRVAIGVYDWEDDALVRIRRVEVDVTGTESPVEKLEGEPAGAFVLVNDDDLTFAKVELDDRSLAVLTDHLAAVAEPLPRTLVWSSAWDMVRDGVMPASQFVDLVIRNVASESEIGVLQRMLLRANGAAERYAATAHRDELLDRLAEAAHVELERAEPGSDPQLAWVRQYANVGRRLDHRERVRGLLDGAWSVPGLEVDTDLRWHLVVSLARAGSDADALIADELERDPTDMGRRHAESAWAARPTRAAKREAWDKLLEDTDLSLAIGRSIWGGFSQLSQPDVIGAMVDDWFAALDRVWEERSLDWAIEFSAGTFPHAAASDELLERVDALLAREDLDVPLRRTLLEERDTLRRTLRARARDAD